LIIGAALLLMMLTFESALFLEGMACASGVPNCD
jgi:hypothetical protein